MRNDEQVLNFGDGKKMPAKKARKLVTVLSWTVGGLGLGIIALAVYAFRK